MYRYSTAALTLPLETNLTVTCVSKQPVGQAEVLDRPLLNKIMNCCDGLRPAELLGGSGPQEN